MVNPATLLIATAPFDRHTVTIIARSRPGLPERTTDPAGFEIRRVPVSATDGLPFVTVVVRIRDLLRAIDARRAARGRQPASAGNRAAAPSETRANDPTRPQDELRSGTQDAAPAIRSLPRRMGARLLTALAA